MNALPPFYRIIFRTWRELDGDRAGDELALQASSDTPLPVSQFSSCNTYRLGQQKRYREPNCVLHFYGDYTRTMSLPNFTAEDFAKWNTTSSCFRLPKHLIGIAAIKDVRVAIIEAIGDERVCAVQALPDNKYRIEFTSPSYKIGYDINGLNFHGVNITPMPAYEQLVQVFIDRAPLHMSGKYLFSSLSPFGHVVHIQDLCVRGFQNIRTGTRIVTMSVLKPIPTELQIANFLCSVRHKGQPPFCLVCKAFGHLARNCPQGPSKTSATRKVPAKPADSQQCTRPMEVSISAPPKSFAEVTAAHPEHPGASVMESAVDPTRHAVPPIIMEQSSAAAAHTTSKQLVI